MYVKEMYKQYMLVEKNARAVFHLHVTEHHQAHDHLSVNCVQSTIT